MNFNTTDTTAKVIKRIKLANNGYVMTYSKHAADGASNMGYPVQAKPDFEGDVVYYISQRR
mgnify:CR=1 FL=1